MDPLISIVIDTYNYANYIDVAIKSALNQTVHADMYEVIVVDDGSIDNTSQLVAAFGTKVIYHWKANGGQASAFNVGGSLARGEFICFMDADDYFYPGKLEAVLNEFKQDDSIGIVFNKFDIVDQNGEVVRSNLPQKLHSGNIRDRVLLGYLSGSPSSGISIRKNVISEIRIPEEAFRISADYFYLNIIPLVCNVGVVETSEHAYRVHNSNLYINKGKADQLLIHVMQNRSVYQFAGGLGFSFFTAMHEMNNSPEAGRALGRLRILSNGLVWLCSSSSCLKLRTRSLVKLLARFFFSKNIYESFQLHRETL